MVAPRALDDAGRHRGEEREARERACGSRRDSACECVRGRGWDGERAESPGAPRPPQRAPRRSARGRGRLRKQMSNGPTADWAQCGGHGLGREELAAAAARNIALTGEARRATGGSLSPGDRSQPAPRPWRGWTHPRARQLQREPAGNPAPGASGGQEWGGGPGGVQNSPESTPPPSPQPVSQSQWQLTPFHHPCPVPGPASRLWGLGSCLNELSHWVYFSPAELY